MGKYDHIPELTGAANYIAWETHVCLALANEDLWCHISTATDPLDLLGLASYLPVPVVASAPTVAETTAMRMWLIDSSKAKTILLCCLTPGVSLLIPRTTNVTARAIWAILRDHFHRSDISSQYVIRQQIQALRMKDSLDRGNYVGQHISYHDRLIGMGATYSNEEAVFHLLSGLPASPIWQQFRSQLEQRMHDTFSATVVSSTIGGGAPVPAMLSAGALTFEDCVARITAEATCHVNKQSMISGPGSDAAVLHTAPSSCSNPITGLHRHKNNPEGIFCLTPGCGKGDHDQAHCYSKGGGMEGQAPWKRWKKGEITAAATIPLSVPAPSTISSAVPGSPRAEAATITFFGDLSCASTIELPDVSSLLPIIFSTILDSGTMSTLIKDQAYFWSYSTENVVTVRTSNHGTLPTYGCGDCVALLTINGQKHRVCLSNCLHAPSATINLLSVGQMLSKGWECNFRGSPARCELVYRGTALGSLPMSSNLFFIDLEFLRPPDSVVLLSSASGPEDPPHRLPHPRPATQELHLSCVHGVHLRDIAPPTLPIIHPPPPSVSDSVEDEDAIHSDSDTIGFPTVLANLLAVKLTGVAPHSDSCRNPLAPGYDMKIPPKTYDEALPCSDRDLWLAAMHNEMNLMSKMNVYELVCLPVEHRAISCRWVLEFKMDLKGDNLSAYKARLIAQGFLQVPGIDFGKTFAPVAESTSIRVISVPVALNDWELDSFNAKWAFLWGKLQEDVYMHRPPGFEQSGPGGEHLAGRDTDLHAFVSNLASEYHKILVQHNSFPGPEPRHYSTAKHVLRYLARTISLCMYYGGATEQTFSDSCWDSCLTQYLKSFPCRVFTHRQSSLLLCLVEGVCWIQLTLLYYLHYRLHCIERSSSHVLLLYFLVFPYSYLSC